MIEDRYSRLYNINYCKINNSLTPIISKTIDPSLHDEIIFMNQISKNWDMTLLNMIAHKKPEFITNLINKNFITPPCKHDLKHSKTLSTMESEKSITTEHSCNSLPAKLIKEPSIEDLTVLRKRKYSDSYIDYSNESKVDSPMMKKCSSTPTSLNLVRAKSMDFIDNIEPLVMKLKDKKTRRIFYHINSFIISRYSLWSLAEINTFVREIQCLINLLEMNFDKYKNKKAEAISIYFIISIGCKLGFEIKQFFEFCRDMKKGRRRDIGGLKETNRYMGLKKLYKGIQKYIK